VDVHSDEVPVTITSHGNGCTGQIMWRQSHLHGGNTAPAPFTAGEQLVQSKRPLLAGWQHSLCLSLTGRCAWLLAYPQDGLSGEIDDMNLRMRPLILRRIGVAPSQQSGFGCVLNANTIWFCHLALCNLSIVMAYNIAPNFGTHIWKGKC
jgi:hypothetical protein